jgi:hypothetical protein
MDFSAFSHGQIHSKLWLCEQIEKFVIKPEVPSEPKIAILGSWYNILGFLLLVRNDKSYKQIIGIDVDKTCIQIANKIGNAFYVNTGQLENWNMSANDVPYEEFDLIINTSIENIKDDLWFNRIPEGKFVCFQACDLMPEKAENYDNWFITNPINNLDDLKAKFPLSIIYYQGSKSFDYGELKYNRYMIIGKK